MPLTTNPKDPCLIEGQKDTGQNECYLVLSEEERAKGFIRPYRDAYIHVGQQIDTSRMRELTTEEKERHKQWNYIGFVPSEDPENPIIGRYIAESDLKKGCGTVTTMGKALSETYARDPKFYGATFCCGCNKHLPVREFRWTADNEIVGS